MTAKTAPFKKNVLGKGLNALIPQKAPAPSGPEAEAVVPAGQVREIEISRIQPNKAQPRVIFEQDKLEELCRSIKEHGVIQPILLKPEGEGYSIVFGERRFRAVKMLGLATIPALIQETNDENNHVIALIENIQRENLNAIEEADAYSRLMNEFRMTQEEVAAKVGKSRSAIGNLVRLLNLPSEIQNLLIERKLSMGHIRTLLAVENPDVQLSLAYKAVEEAWSVRELEKKVYSPQERKEAPAKGDEPSKKTPRQVSVDPQMNHLLEKLQHRFLCKVEMQGSLDKGKMVIEYHSGGDLQRIVELLGISE